MWWRIGSEWSISIEQYIHEIVMMGIGHLEKIGTTQTSDLKDNYLIYLCEPLVILHLSSLFAKYRWTTKEVWIKEAFTTARNNLSPGFIFEESVLLVLLVMFGGKTCALSNAFHTNQRLKRGDFSVIEMHVRQ